MIDLRLGPDAPSVTVHKPPYIRESDAGAFELVRAMEPLKHAEQLVHILHVEADPIVANEHDGLAVRIARHADLNAGPRPRCRVLHRI